MIMIQKQLKSSNNKILINLNMIQLIIINKISHHKIHFQISHHKIHLQIINHKIHLQIFNHKSHLVIINHFH